MAYGESGLGAGGKSVDDFLGGFGSSALISSTFSSTFGSVLGSAWGGFGVGLAGGLSPGYFTRFKEGGKRE